jgi:hypothetical protein
MNTREQKDFKTTLDIDKERLDDECLEQPRKVWYYGRLYARAVKKWDRAVGALKVIEADVDAEIREDPGAFGLDKITEPAVKRAILRSKKYQEAQEVVHSAHERVNMLDAANRSLDHRRTSLTMLNSQDERNYFSKPGEAKEHDRGRGIHRKPLRKKTDG